MTNTLRKCSKNKMLAWWKAIFRDSLWLFLLWLINWPKVQSQQAAVEITEHLLMVALKSVKTLADISLSPSLQDRYFWQIKFFSFYTLSNIRQIKFVFFKWAICTRWLCVCPLLSSSLRDCKLFFCRPLPALTLLTVQLANEASLYGAEA